MVPMNEAVPLDVINMPQRTGPDKAGSHNRQALKATPIIQLLAVRKPS
ncbi:unannotated protein [freshwater metagenome]|uniref:Unannotated protein n=1 Tax=freshwater metagenome TaxID=449393 RepID=A0A6J5ZPK4_9ZZZZ